MRGRRAAVPRRVAALGAQRPDPQDATHTRGTGEAAPAERPLSEEWGIPEGPWLRHIPALPCCALRSTTLSIGMPRSVKNPVSPVQRPAAVARPVSGYSPGCLQLSLFKELICIGLFMIFAITSLQFAPA
ncbi:hypothetical protein WISP_43462 [Willisornis vidua]|uniref:Uncharacterized protein n=1 Tax=Willisornis vidua TaxID=1566151 RepID=A0ABQ9DMB6_9PASS|nr:hypothetical protein WISP_43462 [Willisornis vidua]